MAKAFTLGIIGVGNMGGALVRGIAGSGALAPERIAAADADGSRSAALAEEWGVHPAQTNLEAARESEFVVLAVKPAMVAPVVEEIAEALTEEQTLVSVAAGVPLSGIRASLRSAKPALVRVMPNTPALVGAGLFAVAAPGVPRDRVGRLRELLEAAGDVVEIEEGMMDAVTGLSGSGPAFVFVMIEALADGGVAAGLPRAIAHRLAVGTVEGAARLLRETGEHPGALKDAVASPGGTTIAGLAELERKGFRSAVASAVRAAAKRSRELSEGH